MKGAKYILTAVAATLLVGCFKSVSYDTTYIIKPLAQAESGGVYTPFAGLTAFAYGVDTTEWRVASYEDALAGRITNKSTDQTQSTPDAISEAIEIEGLSDCIALNISAPTIMVVAVDVANKIYAYRQQSLGKNLPQLFTTFVLRTWRLPKQRVYADSDWIIVNDFYTPEPPPAPETPDAPTAVTNKNTAR